MSSPNPNRNLKGEEIPRGAVIYDPIVRGIDLSFWKKVSGTPAIASNKIRISEDTIASYYQFLYGTFDFAINVPTTPSAGEAKKFGLLNPAASTIGSIYFEIVGAVFRVVSYNDSGTAETTTGTWSGEATEQIFKIEWSKTNIVFSLGGTVVACHKTAVGTVPQALYLINEDADNTDIGYVLVKDAGQIIS